MKLPTESQMEAAEAHLDRLHSLPVDGRLAYLEGVSDGDLRDFLRKILELPPMTQNLPPGFQVNDKFRIVSRIGQGGFGVTYRAEQVLLENQVREVVLKFILPELLQPDPENPDYGKEATASFTEELFKLMKLKHPHIVDVFDAGWLESGDSLPRVPWLAMPFVAGERLLELSPSGDGAFATPYLDTLAKKLTCLRDACDAMHHAHGRGFHHLDLTPANILVQPDGAPMILDFGLARPARLDCFRYPWLFAGTLPFMAPEQFPEGQGPVDRRTDIHSLGVLLYALLTDHLPYRLTGRPTQEAYSHVICHQERLPLRTFWSAAPPALEQIVATAIARDSSRRFRDAAEFRDALTDYLKTPSSPAAAAAPAPARTHIGNNISISGGTVGDIDSSIRVNR